MRAAWHLPVYTLPMLSRAEMAVYYRLTGRRGGGAQDQSRRGGAGRGEPSWVAVVTQRHVVLSPHRASFIGRTNQA